MHPEVSKSFLNGVLASTSLMSSIVINGKVFGKSSAVTRMGDTRAILPLPALLQIVDAGLATYLHQRLDSLLPPVPGCFVAARPGTQALEVAHGLHLVIEKGLDTKSKAAVAQADIQAFYDSMRMLKIGLWLCIRGVPPEAVACMLRHQMLPEVTLHMGAASAAIRGRSVGGLTGSRLAGAFGRVPVE